MSGNETQLGKITYAEVGWGGYQGVQFGVSFLLEGGGYGVGDFWGAWGTERSDGAEWSEEDRVRQLGAVMWRLRDLLKAARKERVSQLVGVPVAVTFDCGRLVNWRILTEVV